MEIPFFCQVERKEKKIGVSRCPDLDSQALPHRSSLVFSSKGPSGAEFWYFISRPKAFKGLFMDQCQNVNSKLWGKVLRSD